MPIPMQFDETLLEKIKHDDEHAFKAIYDRYWSFMFAIALQKTGKTVVAEEVVQNIFIDLWENRHRKEISNLRSYLGMSVRYAVINYIKNQLVQERYKQHEQLHGNPNPSIETTYNLKELNACIEAGIASLPQKTQDIFKLSRFESRTNKEIAQDFQISEKAVEYHITQSIKTLRRHLKDYVVLFIYFFLNSF
ncbi:RNA polymerase sigma-70 factor [Sphingobacterium psychroaquaticum]|nr:RNA polymerase sigma-70 factor [Sphingobacterium psychroaquaticum]